MGKILNSKRIVILLMLCVLITGLFGLVNIAVTSTQSPIAMIESETEGITKVADRASIDYNVPNNKVQYVDNYGKPIVFNDGVSPSITYSSRDTITIAESDYTLPAGTVFKSWTIRTFNSILPPTANDSSVDSKSFKFTIYSALPQDPPVGAVATYNRGVTVVLNLEMVDSVVGTALVSSVNKTYNDTATTIGYDVDGEDTTNYSYTYSWTKSGMPIAGAVGKTVEVKNAADTGNYICSVVIASKGDSTYFVKRALGTVIPVAIARVVVTLENVPSISRVYDTTSNYDHTSIDISGITVKGSVGDDSLTLKAITKAEFGSPDVTDVAAIRLTGELDGDEAANYTINNSAEYSGTITPCKVTIDGITAKNRVYNGASRVELDITNAIIVGRLGNDVLTIGNANYGEADSKNATNNKNVVTSITIGGAAVRNYILDKQPTVTVDIAQKQIGILGLAVDPRQYDKTTVFTVIRHEGLDLNAIAAVGSTKDDVMLKSITATVADANVGSGKAVTFAVTLAGADEANYIFDYAGHQRTTSIEKRQLRLEGVTVNEKVYDGNTTMVVNSHGVLKNIIEGDDVTHTITSCNSKSANAADIVSVAISATVDGSSANYMYVTQYVSSKITSAPIKFTVTEGAKSYNGKVQLPSYTTEQGPMGETVEVKFTGAEAKSVKLDAKGNIIEWVFNVAAASSNYNLVDANGAVVKAALTITPRVIEYTWEGNQVINKAGTPTNITAKITNLCAGDENVTARVLNGVQHNPGHYTSVIIGATSENYKIADVSDENDTRHEYYYTVSNIVLKNNNTTASRPEVKLGAPDGIGFNPDYNFRVDYMSKPVGNYSSLLGETQGIMLQYQLRFSDQPVDSEINVDKLIRITGPVNISIAIMAEWKTAKDLAVLYIDNDGKAYKAVIAENANTIEITSENGIQEIVVARYDPNLGSIITDSPTFWWLIVLLIILGLGAIAALVWYIIVKKKSHNLYFDSSGGCVCERLTAKCKEPIFMPIPEKETVTFSGWYKSASYKKMVNYNKMPFWEETLFAKWVDSNGVVQNYVSADGTKVRASSEKVKAVKGAKIEVTLIFNTRGGNTIDSITAEVKSAIVLPTATKTGEKFVGWFYDNKLTEVALFDTMPQNNTELFAKWESDNKTAPGAREVKSMFGDYSEKSTYGAKHSANRLDSKGNEEITSKPVTNIIGSNENIAKNATEKAADAFIASRFAQTAPQKKNDGITITFATRGGTELRAITASAGDNVSLPTCNKEGSTFLGWYNDANLTKEVFIIKMPSKETMLFAKWAEDATTQELYDKGIVNDDEINKGKKHFQAEQKKIDELMVKSEAGGVIERASTTKSNIALGSAAASGKEGKMRTIEFDCRGGEPLCAIEARENENISIPNAFKPGARFLGWFYDKKCNDMAILTTMPSKNSRLFAKWDR